MIGIELNINNRIIRGGDQSGKTYLLIQQTVDQSGTPSFHIHLKSSKRGEKRTTITWLKDELHENDEVSVSFKNINKCSVPVNQVIVDSDYLQKLKVSTYYKLKNKQPNSVPVVKRKIDKMFGLKITLKGKTIYVGLKYPGLIVVAASTLTSKLVSSISLDSDVMCDLNVSATENIDEYNLSHSWISELLEIDDVVNIKVQQIDELTAPFKSIRESKLEILTREAESFKRLEESLIKEGLI